MKMLEHVEEGLIRQSVEIEEMKCGFLLGCGTTDATGTLNHNQNKTKKTTDAIFIVRQLQEKHLISNKPLYMAFV